MNWYIEQQGVSRGPLPEEELEAKVRRREIPADALVWHPGMELWAAVREVMPGWLNTAEAELHADPSSAKTPPPPASQPAREVEEKKIPARDSPRKKSSASAAPPPSSAPPAATKLKPQAPTPSAPAASSLNQAEDKPGLFKRLFGGKKKD